MRRAGKQNIFSFMPILAAILVFTMVQPSTSQASGAFQEHSEELIELTREVMPSVVCVYTEGGDYNIELRKQSGESEEIIKKYEFHWPEGLPEIFRGREMPRIEILPKIGEKLFPRGAGTGIIMDDEGHIVTASHIVDKSRKNIRVRLYDKRELEAKFVGSDPDTGVAVIKIDAEELNPIKVSHSDDVRVGSLTLAFGNRYGKDIIVSMGIISATSITDLGIANYEDFIQTDASVGPGSAGGPLVNSSGQAIGMILALRKDSGDSTGPALAVPINVVVSIMEDLISEGKVTRGWLGVEIQDIDRKMAEKFDLESPRGVLVVESGGPAREGGIQSGDVIIEFDGKIIENTAHLKSVVARTKTGREVMLTVKRKDEMKDLYVTIGERTEKSIQNFGKRRSEPQEAGWMGINVQELDRDLAKKFGYEEEEGVLVSYVKPGSHAHKKGIKEGDLIQEIDHKAIKSIQDYDKAMKEAEESVLLRIKRGRQTWYEVINIEESD